MTTLGKAAPRTTLPPRPQARSPQAQQKRPLGGIRTPDVLALAGALAAALSTTGLLWTQIGPFSGAVGYVVVSWCLFVLFYALLVSFDENGPAVRDRVVSVLVHSLGALVLLVLAYVIIYTFFRGWRALVHLNFFTQ